MNGQSSSELDKESAITISNDGGSQYSASDSSDTSTTEPGSSMTQRLTKSHNITDTSPSLSHAKSEELLHETKYVMLNFMSLVPPKLYKNHVHPSPDLTKPHSTDSNRFSKSLSHLSKSKSFDVVHLGKSHRQSQLSRARAIERDLDSPQSEDNVNYRYRQNQIGFGLGQLNGTPNSLNSEIDQHLDESDGIKDLHGVSSIEAISSAEGSPRKASQTMNRLISDTSSCGDYSYYSDADDEYEVSHSSSTFSVASVSQTDGLLDLRKNSGVLKHHMGRSVSELEDTNHPKHTYTDTIPETQDEDNDAAEVTGEPKDDNSIIAISQDQGGGDGLDEADAPLFALSERGIADRSKLKLTIPPQPVVIDDILLSLQSELNSEISEMESEFEEAKAPAAVTPTRAARTLARIGDEVMEQYSGQIATTVNQLFLYKIGELSYQQFKEVSAVMIDRKLPGWRQVALLMVYGQTAAWYAVKGGNKNIGNIVDYCSRFVFDVAAEFIIKEGGWGAVMNFDPSQSSDTQSSADFDSPPADYFTSHDVTQVESDPTQNLDQPTYDIHTDTQHSCPLSESPSSNIQHSSHISDLSPQPDTQIAQGVANSFTQLLVQSEGTLMYKPSLGFDFRNVSTPTGVGEGSLKSNPNSSNSLQFVFDNGVEQFGEVGPVLDDECNEEVFESGLVDGNSATNLDKELDNIPDDNVDGSLSKQAADLTFINQNSIQSNSTRGEDLLKHKNILPVNNNDMEGKVDELSDEIDNQVKQGTKANTSAIENTPEVVHPQPVNSDDLKDKENETLKDEQSDTVFGYLNDSRTKVLLVAGAAAAVGLGLKFFGR